MTACTDESGGTPQLRCHSCGDTFPREDVTTEYRESDELRPKRHPEEPKNARRTAFPVPVCPDCSEDSTKDD